MQISSNFMNVLKSFTDTVSEIKSKGLLRKVKVHKKYKADYSSNDYLGLSKSVKAKTVLIRSILRYGFGACASKYVSGYSSIHKKLDDAVANYYKKESASVFGTGYMASIGILQGICNSKSIIVADRFIHASWIDGAFVSGTRIVRYNHNDVEHLELLICNFLNKYERIIILTEEVFSMHGTVIDIEKYIFLARKYNAILVTDHAHSLGVLPYRHQNYDLHIVMGTFSKACAGFGGYVCGKHQIIDTITNLGRTQIYSTSLPNYLVAYNKWAFQYATKHTGRMLKKAKSVAERYGLNFKGSAILTKEFQNIEDACAFHVDLVKKSIYVPVIRKPTVPRTIVRFSVTV